MPDYKKIKLVKLKINSAVQISLYMSKNRRKIILDSFLTIEQSCFTIPAMIISDTSKGYSALNDPLSMPCLTSFQDSLVHINIFYVAIITSIFMTDGQIIHFIRWLMPGSVA